VLLLEGAPPNRWKPEPRQGAFSCPKARAWLQAGRPSEIKKGKRLAGGPGHELHMVIRTTAYCPFVNRSYWRAYHARDADVGGASGYTT